MLEKYKKEIKIVFKNYPLPMHQFAGAAATAAMAAHRQGKFWEFHHKLFESSSSLSNEKIQSIARDLKLNMETFNRDLKDPAIQSLISRDMNEGSTAEVPGTPTIFINGKLVQLRNLSEIDQTINAELKKKKTK